MFLGGGLDANHGNSWNIIHSLLCKNPCKLYIHDNFFGLLGLHLLVWSELGWSWPFRRTRVLRMWWSLAFVLVCGTTLSSSHFGYHNDYSISNPVIATMFIVIFWATVDMHMIFFKDTLIENIGDIIVVAHCNSPTLYSTSPTCIPLAPSSKIYKLFLEFCFCQQTFIGVVDHVFFKCLWFFPSQNSS